MTQILSLLVDRLPARLQPYAKAVLPFVIAAAAVVVQWAITGEFDRAELVTAITGAGAALVTLLAPNKRPALR
jgi:hypothetical protein